MSDSLDVHRRPELLANLASETFDLIVIGGGITGAGILREASLRGLSAVMLEANDFASGTSSKSTKLIHGGLRYLAMGHIHVVREAMRERQRVHELAPHLAEPKWLLLPASNRFELMKYQLGVTVYEKLGQVTSDDIHFNVSGAKLRDYEPLLDTNNFPYACIYREYLTDDARLVLANVRSGVEAGGLAVNRLKVTGLIKEANKTRGVEAECQLSGEKVRVRGKVVINAAGPWVQQVAGLDNLPMPKSMVLSKGIHIVVSREKLPVREMVFTVSRDERPVFVIPRGDMVYIGTTDSPYQGADIWPEVLAEEVEYLFEPVKRYFDVDLKLDDCLTSWAGLRPLIYEPGKSTKEISRRDEIWVSQSGLLTIAGGKLTGYRKMAEDTVNKACELMGIKLDSSAGDDPLPGGDLPGSLDQQSLDLTQHYPMKEASSQRLVRLYGSECTQVLGLGHEPIIPDSMIFDGEVLWAMSQEGAHNLEDVLYRRSRAALYQPDEIGALVEPVARIMAENLGWSEDQYEQEVKQVRQRLSTDVEFRQQAVGIS